MTNVVKQQMYFYNLWIVLGYIILGSIIFLSLTPDPPVVMVFPSIDKIEHLLAYMVLMGWFCQIYLSRKRQIFLAIMFCTMGIWLEFMQYWGGHRLFEYEDMLADSMGVFLGWWISGRICVGWLARFERILTRW